MALNRFLAIMNDIYVFYIYILIIHYIIQLYNIRVWLASRLRTLDSFAALTEKAKTKAKRTVNPTTATQVLMVESKESVDEVFHRFPIVFQPDVCDVSKL
jgi:hypothetical protein